MLQPILKPVARTTAAALTAILLNTLWCADAFSGGPEALPDPVAGGYYTGTLGMTYDVPSKPVPHDFHPRSSIIRFCFPPEALRGVEPGLEPRFTVQDFRRNLAPLRGFKGDDDFYYFESRALVPGVPHIYVVKVELIRKHTRVLRQNGRLHERNADVVVQTLGHRSLRLIPGRMVDLRWNP